MPNAKQAVGQIPAGFGELRIHAVSAKVIVRTNNAVEQINVLADTPANWTIKDGVVCETGGKVSEALALSSNRSISFINNVLYINSARIDLPEQPEELIVELPKSFVEQLYLLSDVVAAVRLEAELALGVHLTAKSQVRGKIQLCKQISLNQTRIEASGGGCIIGHDLSVLADLSVKASQSSRIELGGLLAAGDLKIMAAQSAVVGVGDLSPTHDLILTASQNGVVKALFCHAGKAVKAKSDQNGRVEADVLSAVDSVVAETSQNGKIEAGTIKGKEAKLTAAQNGGIEVSLLEVTSVTAEAGMSGSITVKAGSAQSGTAKASMAGDIDLRGSFAAISRKQSMGGSVSIK